jgi:two-component system response regulator FixJ
MTSSTVIVIDDHDSVRTSVRVLLELSDFRVKDYPSASSYLSDPQRGGDCLVVDLRMPEMTGLELHEELVRRQIAIPVIVITGHGDVPLAVTAMRAGVFDFIEKPFDEDVLLTSVRRAVAAGRDHRSKDAEKKAAIDLLSLLTPREGEVLRHLVLGKSNKIIGHELGISPRTVEIHRAHLQEKLKARDLSDLVRLTVAAGEAISAMPDT